VLHKECHKQLTYTKSEKLKARFIEQKALKELTLTVSLEQIKYKKKIV